MDQTEITKFGNELFDALKTCSAVEPLTARSTNLTIEDAYKIQEHIIDRRLATGETVVGKKIGVTSAVVQKMLNVHQPDFGWLLSGMLYNEGDVIPAEQFIAPRAEGEIAFILKHDLEGPGITVAHVLAATEAVVPCFEIVDSRIRDWKIKIEDTVADNASCGAIVLGDQLISPRDIDLALCGMVLEKNGQMVGTGAGAAAMGHPASAVAWLANMLGSLGIPLKSGEIILSGSLSNLIAIESGDALRMEIGGMGGCSVRFV